MTGIVPAEVSTTVVVALPIFIFTIIVAFRIARVTRPVPKITDNVSLLKKVKWRTGDIVLFHAHPVITFTSDGPWSHVGVVCVGNSGVPRLFEIDGTTCVAKAKPLLPIILKQLWQGDKVVAFRRIKNISNTLNISRFIAYCLKKRVTYEHLYWRTLFIRSFGWGFPIDPRDEEAEINHRSVCSSLVTRVLQQAGVVSPNINPYNILPSDYGEPCNVPLAPQYSWGAVTFLRLSSTG